MCRIAYAEGIDNAVSGEHADERAVKRMCDAANGNASASSAKVIMVLPFLLTPMGVWAR